MSRAADSRHKYSSVVKVRVTSTKRAPGKTGKVAALETRLRSASDLCSMRQQKLKPTHANRLFPLETKFRDGAEPSCFVCHTTRGCRPATLFDFPPGLMLFGANRNRPAVRAGAVGAEEPRPARHSAQQKNRLLSEEVGRGEGQGYFACSAGGREFESHLVHQFEDALRSCGGPVAQW